MEYKRYSPFQFATSEQASENTVMPAKKYAAKLKSMLKTPPKPSLLSIEEARSIPGTPTAFLSPNSTDVMRTARSVFGC
jgi:hypothetical protein